MPLMSNANHHKMRISLLAKSVVSALFAALAVSAAGVYWFHSSFGPLCANEVISETASPDGKLRAIVFQRDCGATTGFSTQVALLPRTEKFEESTASFFSADTNHGLIPSGPGGGPEVAVHWNSHASLVVSHHPDARIFRSESKSNNVQIQYAPVVKSAV